MRLIDADVIIKALDDALDDAREDGVNLMDVLKMELFKNFMKQIISYTPTVESEPAQWIPITEALPKTDDIVLVTCVTKSGLKSVNRAYCDDRGFWHGSGSMAGVVAWLPLPKPYEGA